MIDRSTIAQASRDQLPAIYTTLIVERMKLDKQFSVFLDETEMSETDVDTPEWSSYRTKVMEYGQVVDLISVTQYYMKRYEQPYAS